MRPAQEQVDRLADLLEQLAGKIETFNNEVRGVIEDGNKFLARHGIAPVGSPPPGGAS